VADCIHQLDLCPDCEGLRVVKLDRIEGLTDIKIVGGSTGSFTLRGPAQVYMGPVEPCPNDRQVSPRG